MQGKNLNSKSKKGNWLRVRHRFGLNASHRQNYYDTSIKYSVLSKSSNNKFHIRKKQYNGHGCTLKDLEVRQVLT